MTWHSTENYGTAFQAYALGRLIVMAGCEVELIDYKRLGDSPLQQMSLSTLLKGYCLAIFCRKSVHTIRYKFNSNTFKAFWNKHFCYTKDCETNQDYRDLNAHYDGFVCGSDQIWGPEWFDARFFLDFVEDQRRLISYAPSIGVPEITNKSVAREMGSLMNRFPYLSVREETGCRIAAELTGRNDVVNVLDPVLALPSEEWEKLQEEVMELPQKYSFIFFLKNNEENIKTSIKAAEEKGCKPVVLHCTQSEDTPFANTGDLTPGQLLTYIQNADYVCTDSFHMVVLSIIFGRNFKVFKKDSTDSKTSKNNRITDLLNRFGIGNAEYDVNPSFEEKINYNKVYSILNELRQASFSYLKNAIDQLPEDKTEISELECEIKARVNGTCKGEQLEEFIQYGQGLKGKLFKKYTLMSQYPFALQEKCYRCMYFRGCVKLSDNRKPLFWNDLKADLIEKKSIAYVFRKYYLAYSFSKMLHRN